MVDRMQELNDNKDLRFLAAAVRLTNGGAKTSAFFASDIVGRDCNEKDCIEYIVALYRIYSALEDAWAVTGEGRVRTLHKPHLSRKNLLRNELAYFFSIDAASVHDHIEENFPPSPVLRDCVKRIKHIVVVNPILLIAYMYAMYAGTFFAREFRKGLLLCAPNISRICVFHDLDVDPCPIEYQQSVDSLGLSPEEADEIISELKHMYTLQVALFHELDVKRGKVSPALRSISERTAARITGAIAYPNDIPLTSAALQDVTRFHGPQESGVRFESDQHGEQQFAAFLQTMRLLRQDLIPPSSNTAPPRTPRTDAISTPSGLLRSVMLMMAMVIIAMLPFFFLNTTC
eukprot:GEMP01027314.1.p1 GENE.GEMP01027314.1~~GEMP01027314.1.p1  ORF type:complete len:345 (+),score=51.26 GEMP01027314.1:317-1351(+)